MREVPQRLVSPSEETPVWEIAFCLDSVRCLFALILY